MIEFYYNIKHGISNLISWFKVIWNDRNWDYNYIYIVLRKKLDNTRKCIKKYQHHVYWERDYNDISKVIYALDRLIKDDYYDMVFKQIEEEFGRLEFESKPLEGGCSSITFYRDKVDRNNEKEVERERKKSRAAHKRIDYLKKQDKMFVFNQMCKHIDSWWD